MPKYCLSCGAANQNNAVICSRCGKAFIIGTNPVSQNVNGQPANASPAANKKERSVFFDRNVIDVFFKVLKAPFSTGRKVVTEGGTAIGVSLIILQAFFTGLFGVIMISKINERMGDFDDLKLSYIRGFFVSVFGSAALSFLIALIAMLLLMLFRVKTTYTRMLLVTGIRCVGIIPVIVLAILVSFLHVGWGIAVFMVSAMTGYIFMGRVLTAGSVFWENKAPYVFFLLVIVTVAIQCFMIAKIWPFYLPDMLRADYYEFLKKMKEGSDGFWDMIKNMFDYWL